MGSVAKKNKKSIMLSMLILPVFFSGAFGAGLNMCKDPAPTPVTIEVWGVFDDSTVYSQLINEFKKQAAYSHITVNYHKQNIVTYEQDLIDALAAGRGPDVFMIHNTWLPKHQNKLAAASETLITARRYGEIYPEVATQDFILDNKVYAFPLSIDTLALFYNADLFNTVGIALPPATWAEFNSDVSKLTKLDAKNNILQAGAALGTSKNVNRSTDILAALMMQSGSKMVSDDKSTAALDQMRSGLSGSGPGLRALKFYTNFATPGLKVYTWNKDQHYSIDAFAEGKAAMMLNYQYQIASLRAKAPHLNFEIAALPQISTTSGAQVNFANYWALAVSKSSVKQTASWQFITWLAQKENSKKYLDLTGKPAARRDLIEEQQISSSVNSIFAKQALSAKSWWEADYLAIENILAEMIENVVAGQQTPNDALSTANRQITLLMEKD